ncbi:MAG: hypothetical protein B1H08_04435 [Candidatus Omnitrophica bacterium 4484_171]|nr:MAG: hypothetical protein B1H08_04435 [Candidatus Omnitrophica bacterium 4484_171]
MSVFKYSGRDSNGKLITGVKNADSRASVITQLRQNNIFPISIEEQKPSPKLIRLKRFRLKNKDVTVFTRQLSNLLGSGVLLRRALTILGNRIMDSEVKSIISQVNEHVVGGGSLWEALSRYPDIFSSLYVNMIKAGEASGTLDKVINSLADFYETKKELKGALVSMLIYPVILAVVGLGTVIFLMTYVIPRMLFIFEGINTPLPLITKILIRSSLLMAKYWWLLILCALAVFVVVRSMFAKDNVRMAWDEFMLKVPFAGRIIRKLIFARFTEILGLCLSNGISILESLDIAKGVIQNKFIARKLSDVIVGVSQGTSLSASLYKAKVFPSAMLDMIAVSEEIGKPEESLSKISQTYNKEVSQEIRRFLELLEPAIIFLLALGIGFLVMAVLLPIFQINLQSL